MNTKLAFLLVLFMLSMSFYIGFAQEHSENSFNANVDTIQNISKKKRFKLFSKEKKQSNTLGGYQLSEEEIRLRNTPSDSLSKKERRKLDKSYKKETKYYNKAGKQNGNDSIAQQLLMQNPEYEGMNLSKNDIRTLTRINKKYALTNEDKLLITSNPDTLGMFQHFKIARIYRKKYKRKKKLQKFWKKKIYSMQPPDAKKRMKEHEKKVKQRDRRRRWEMRKKRFLNLFR